VKSTDVEERRARVVSEARGLCQEVGRLCNSRPHSIELSIGLAMKTLVKDLEMALGELAFEEVAEKALQPPWAPGLTRATDKG